MLPGGTDAVAATAAAARVGSLMGLPDAETTPVRGALERSTRAVRDAAADGDDAAEGAALLQSAGLLSAIGESDRSIACARRAAALLQRSGNTLGEARAHLLVGLGMLAVDRGDEGIEAVAEAAVLLESADGPPGELASACAAIAGAYAELDIFEVADAYGRRALALAREAGEEAACPVALRVAADLAAWGELLREWDDAAAARARFREGLEIAERCGPGAARDPALHLLRLLALGECRLGLDDAARAAEPLREALAGTMGQPRLAARAALRLGEALSRLGQFPEADRHLRLAVELSTEETLLRTRCRAHRSRAALLEAMGDLTGALAEHRAFQRAADQRARHERLRRLDAVRTRARLAKAQLESVELTRLSFEDPLTGLHNRRYAQREVPRLLAEAQRAGTPLAIALVDVDRFKRINDEVSHAAGDAVLRRVAELLRGHCRDADMVARYGGDEFLVAFPGLGARDAGRIAERLRAAVEREDWRPVTGARGVTLSVGVTHAGTEIDPARLVNEADARLYAAKRDGRNRVRLTS